MEQSGSNQRRDYWAISGLNLGVAGLQYCKDNRLSYNSFTYWRQKLDILCKSISISRPTSKREFSRVITNSAQEISSISDGDLTMTLPSGIILQGIRGEHVTLVGQLLRQL